jgi:opacity protein-like surface antigen
MLKSLAAKVLAIFVIAFGIAAALHVDSRADANGKGRAGYAKLRLQGTAILPLGENHAEVWNDCGSGWIDYLSFSGTIDVNTSVGVLANFEYVAAGRYGLEVDLIYWSEVVGLLFDATDISIEGSPNFILPTLGANYHFLTSEKADAYAGALCTLGILATGFGADIEISKDVALGLNLGLDYYVEKSWSIGGSVKYLDFGEVDFSVVPSGWEDLVCDNGLFGIGHLNFVSLNFGIGYRF